MFLPEQDDARHQEIEVGRTERAGPADLRLRIITNADQVDVRLTVDLATAEEEGIKTPLRRPVEQFHAAIGHQVVHPAAQHVHLHGTTGLLPCQQATAAGNGRRRAA